MGKRIQNMYNPRMLPTYRPNRRRRAKKYGFRARMKTAGGRKTIGRRRLKGRYKLTPSARA
jgi:large subunit ribosomal protein L34